MLHFQMHVIDGPASRKQFRPRYYQDRRQTKSHELPMPWTISQTVFSRDAAAFAYAIWSETWSPIRKKFLKDALRVNLLLFNCSLGSCLLFPGEKLKIMIGFTQYSLLFPY